jgi:hypothetical protein
MCECLTEYLTVWLPAECATAWLNLSLTDYATGVVQWLSDWLCDCLTESVTVWLTVRLSYWRCDCWLYVTVWLCTFTLTSSWCNSRKWVCLREQCPNILIILIVLINSKTLMTLQIYLKGVHVCTHTHVYKSDRILRYI